MEAYMFLIPGIYDTFIEILSSRVVLPFVGIFIAGVIYLGVSKLWRMLRSFPIPIILGILFGLTSSIFVYPGMPTVLFWGIVIICVIGVLVFSTLFILDYGASSTVNRIRSGRKT